MVRSAVLAAAVITVVGVGCGRVAESGAASAEDGGESPVAEAGIVQLQDAGADAQCLTPNAPSSSLRRMNKLELANALHDLFGDLPIDVDAIPSGPAEDVGTVTAALVNGYHLVAHDVALRATRDPARLGAIAGCDPSVDGVACRSTFIDTFGPKVFRRPFDAALSADLDQVFATGLRIGGDFASGARAVIEVALQSPEFLYVVEQGRTTDASLCGSDEDR
jgi:hypothetical protein